MVFNDGQQHSIDSLELAGIIEDIPHCYIGVFQITQVETNRRRSSMQSAPGQRPVSWSREDNPEHSRLFSSVSTEPSVRCALSDPEEQNAVHLAPVRSMISESMHKSYPLSMRLHSQSLVHHGASFGRDEKRLTHENLDSFVTKRFHTTTQTIAA